jgi:uncharacterized protein (TIGR02246 family)
MRKLQIEEGRRARSGRLAAAVLIFTLVAPLAAASTPASPAGAGADARREVEAAMQQYTVLLRTGPAEATAGLFTADGELLEPGLAAIHGREAIRAFLAPVFAAVNVESASTESEAVEVYGNAAYQWGTYRQRVAEKGKAGNDYHGRYVASWKRETDGRWRLAKMLVQPFP